MRSRKRQRLWLVSLAVLLLGGAAARLSAEGFAARWPQAVPPNDGGLALGQLLGAARALGEA